MEIMMSKSEYNVTLPDGDQVIVDNLSLYCKVNSLSYPCMMSIMNPNTSIKSHKGYKVTRDSKRKVYTLSIDGQDFTDRFDNVDVVMSDYIDTYGKEDQIRIGEIVDEPYDASEFFPNNGIDIILGEMDKIRIQHDSEHPNMNKWSNDPDKHESTTWLSNISTHDRRVLSYYIDEAINNWAKKTNNHPNFINVENVKDYEY